MNLTFNSNATVLERNIHSTNQSRNCIIDSVRLSVESRNKEIEKLYLDEDLRNIIASFILKSGGNNEDFQDVFAYAIMTFIKQCYRPNFNISKDLQSYIFIVAKNKWIKIAKERKEIIHEDKRTELMHEDHAESRLMYSENLFELNRAMTKLDVICREVLTMWSEGMARKKKHKCLKRLKALILENK